MSGPVNITVLETLEQALTPFLPSQTHLAVTDPTVEHIPDHPADLQPTGTMRPGRRREFLAGRTALRRAIRATGTPCGAIPMLPDRAPDLPAGVAASLTHSSGACLAIAAPDTRFAALGIDVEPARPLDTGLTSTVLTRAERARIATLGDPQMIATRIFCAKEAAYKCQFAMTGALLDFDAFDVSFWGDNRLSASFRQPVPPFATGDSLAGRIVEVAGLVICVCFIPA